MNNIINYTQVRLRYISQRDGGDSIMLLLKETRSLEIGFRA